jgi:hypothetical protein
MRQDALHERLEVIISVAMLVVIRRHAQRGQIDDCDAQLERNAID